MSVLRLCARIDDFLPVSECAVPDRCDHETKRCSVCGWMVHYDPKASIPLLGAERIVCTWCLEDAKGGV